MCAHSKIFHNFNVRVMSVNEPLIMSGCKIFRLHFKILNVRVLNFVSHFTIFNVQVLNLVSPFLILHVQMQNPVSHFKILSLSTKSRVPQNKRYCMKKKKRDRICNYHIYITTYRFIEILSSSPIT